MTRRILYPLCISVALVGLAACGGRASSADADSDLTGIDVPSTNAPGIDVPSTNAPSTDAPSTDLPSTDLPGTNVPAELDTLELRRFDDDTPIARAPLGCEYAHRVKVSFRSRWLTTRTCESAGESVSRGSESRQVLDTDLERVRSAYAELRVVNGTQCKSSADRLSLAVLSEDDSDRQLLDAEHSGCPLRGVEGEAFVQGLDQLYRVLAEL